MARGARVEYPGAVYHAKKAFYEGYSMEEIARYIRFSAVAVFKYINRQGQPIS